MLGFGVSLGALSFVGVPWGPSGSGRCPDTSSPSRSITVKDLKAMLPQVNYRVPNMRFLRDKLVVRPAFCGERGFESPQQGRSRPRCHWMSLHQPPSLTPCPTGGGSQERDDLLPLHPVLQKPDVRRAEVGKSRDPSPQASLPRSASPAVSAPFPFALQVIEQLELSFPLR